MGKNLNEWKRMGGYFIEKELEDKIYQAANLAHWLITKKGMKAKVAYIIAANKYKIHPQFRGEISKKRQDLKSKQQTLI